MMQSVSPYLPQLQATARQGAAPAALRVLVGEWTGDLVDQAMAHAAAAGHPFRLEAEPGDDPMATVAAVSIEDVFPELGWRSPDLLDADTLDQLLAGAGRRIDKACCGLRARIEAVATRWVVVPPVLPVLPLPVAERSMAIRLARLGERITDALIDEFLSLPGGSVLDVADALDTLPRPLWSRDSPEGHVPHVVKRRRQTAWGGARPSAAAGLAAEGPGDGPGRDALAGGGVRGRRGACRIPRR